MKPLYCLVVLAALLLLLPGCQSRYMTSGKVYVQQNNWEKAREQFELEVQSNPSNGEAHALLGQGYEKAGEYEKAGQSFSKAKDVTTNEKKLAEIVAIQEQFAVDHIKYGNSAFESQNYETAVEEYRNASLIYPGYMSAQKNMAIALLQAERYDESKNAWEGVIGLAEPGDQEWLQAHDVLAKMAMEDSSFSEAIEHIDQKLEYKPDDVGLLELKAGCLDAQDDHEGALNIYKQIVEQNPENTDAMFNAAVMLVKLQRLEDAEAMFEKVVTLVPDDKEAQYNLGLMAMNLQRWEMAEQAFAKVVELDAGDAHAWQNLGICLLNLGKTKEGQDAFKKSEELGLDE